MHAARDPDLGRQYAALHARTRQALAGVIIDVYQRAGQPPPCPPQEMAQMILATEAGIRLEQAAEPEDAAPSAAKAFQVTFTQALAAELAGTGVQVQACCPGLVDTEFHALAGRDLAATPFPVMSPEQVVGAALAGLRLGEVLCVPGLDDPGMTDTVSQAQQALLMTAVGSPLASRYRQPEGREQPERLTR